MPAVTFLITDLLRGGSPLMLADLAPGLVRHGWEVEVVSIAPRAEIADVLQERGVQVCSLEARFKRDVAVVPRFVRHLRERRPDVVCSILVHANLLATMAKPFVGDWAGAAHGQGGSVARTKRIAWVQSIHTLQEKPRWHWTLQGILTPHADGFVAPSQAIVDRVVSLVGGREMPACAVIPNGIDVRRFAEAHGIEHVPWPKGAVVVGAVGRFDPVKRLELLIAAAERLPERFHVALVGYGPEESRLRALAAGSKAAARIHFTGPTREPERWYKVFDVYCNLSSSEGYGLTLAEAVCAGLPVVSCDTPALRQTVTEATWLPARPTATQVAKALEAADNGHRTRVPREALERRYGVEGGVGGGMVGAYDRFFRSGLRLPIGT